MWYKLYQNQLRRSPSTVAQRLARHLTFGRSRVLTPVPPDQVWVFFQRFVHTITSWYVLISQIRRFSGSVSTSALPTTFIRPIHTIPIPNLSVNQSEGALECLSSPPHFGGVSFPFFEKISRYFVHFEKNSVGKITKKYLTLKM
jgi:hypothetical protein